MSSCSLDLAVLRLSTGTLYEIHTDIYIYIYIYVQGVSKVRSDCKLYFAQSI